MSEHQSKLQLSAERAKALLTGQGARRWAIRFAIFMAVVGVLGFFVAPPVLKSVLLRALSAELQRDVSIERIEVNPYALSLRLNGVSVKAGDGQEVAGFDELFVNLSSSALFRFGIVVDEMHLDGLRLKVTRLAEGRYDISDLLDKWLAPSEPSPTPRFSLNNIELSRGKIVFDDRPKNKIHTAHDIHLGVPFLSSLPYQADIVVQPRFSAMINDGLVEFAGRAKPFSENRESELDLALEKLNLQEFAPYLPESLPFQLKSGVLGSTLRLSFRELPGQVYSLGLDGGLNLGGLQVDEKTGAPLIAWKALAIDFGQSDLVNRKIVLDKITLDGLDLNVAINRQGELNWLRLADKLQGEPAKAAKAEPAAAGGAALTWSLGEFKLAGGMLRYRDESGSRPVAGEIRDIVAAVGPADSKLDQQVEVNELGWKIDLGDALKVEKMHLAGIKLDLARHRVDVAEVQAAATRIRMGRDKAGKLDWLAAPALKTRAAAPARADDKPWQANVAKVAVDDLAFRLDDQSTTPAASQVIDGFNLKLSNLSTEPGKKAQLQLSSRVNQKGSLKVDGSVQLTPLAVAVRIDSQAIPLLPLHPYVSDFLNIAVTRGQFSNSGELAVEMGQSGLVGGYRGSATLGDLLTVDKVNNADFLKWRSLYVGGIDFKLAPMSLVINEIALSDFFSRLIVAPTGRLNVLDIVKQADASKSAKDDGTAPARSDAGAKSAAVQGSTEPPKPPMPIRIERVTLQGGSVNFSDFFVKPNYSVNLTKLGGRVNRLSSAADTVADLELRGSYANSAPVLIRGKLNPLAAKAMLDIKGEVSDVDLVPLSPYAGKYAGYNIQKGKLSLAVAYKLENNKLNAENHLFIDQLTFGDKVDSPTATSLPVNLAIALLKNNRGEIDLNLPISGSLDDPQFSIGGLILKVIGNIFVKAVTSPFALLGSMFGGGEELSNVDFAPGRSDFSEATLKKLEALSKALHARESLKLEITGRADPEADREGLKRVALDQAVRAEKQKELIGKARESGSLDSISLGAGEYPVYLARAYKAAKFPKPRNMVGLQRDLPVEEMEKLMLANTVVASEDVRLLAIRRAEAVQGWLLEQGKVVPGRIFLLPPKVQMDDKARASGADFSLR